MKLLRAPFRTPLGFSSEIPHKHTQALPLSVTPPLQQKRLEQTQNSGPQSYGNVPPLGKQHLPPWQTASEQHW